MTPVVTVIASSNDHKKDGGAPATADLFDQCRDVQVLEPSLASYGGLPSCCGQISTLKIFEDNSLVRLALEESGNGRVLVIDGGGSLRCALVGDNIASLALENGWQGIVIYGCIRDSATINTMPLCVRALATNPARSAKSSTGERDVNVHFLGVHFRPGDWLAADSDGVIVSPKPFSGLGR